MSAYSNDPRVRKVNEYLVVVSAPDDDYCVAARNSPDDWWAGNMLGGTSDRAADCRSHEDAQEWARRTTYGPFTTADEAIHKLIGEPW